jgi:hypothetical protein
VSYFASQQSSQVERAIAVDSSKYFESIATPSVEENLLETEHIPRFLNCTKPIG